jgi:hypothetical protein
VAAPDGHGNGHHNGHEELAGPERAAVGAGEPGESGEHAGDEH